jgi:hypothetical protein
MLFPARSISLSAKGLLRRAQNALLAMTFSENVKALIRDVRDVAGRREVVYTEMVITLKTGE